MPFFFFVFFCCFYFSVVLVCFILCYCLFSFFPSYFPFFFYFHYTVVRVFFCFVAVFSDCFFFCFFFCIFVVLYHFGLPCVYFKRFSLSYLACLSVSVVRIPLFLSVLCILFLLFVGFFYSYNFMVRTAINEYGYVTLKSKSGLTRNFKKKQTNT